MSKKQEIKDYIMMLPAALIMAIGIYFFRFPNNFTAGGVTGLGVLLTKLYPSMSATLFTNILNIGLLFVGFAILGKGFGLKTAVFTVILTITMSAFEKLFPISAPLTNQPFMELFLAILLPSIGSAMLFFMGASGGGTDVVALILKKYTHIYNTGVSILIADFIIACFSFVVFDVPTGIFSMFGLGMRMLMIDGILNSLNKHKYFHIVTDDPEPIQSFITHKLKKSATLFDGYGAYSGEKRTLIFTVVTSRDAIDLRNFVKKTQPEAFLLIDNTSEIYGRGFRSNV